MAPKNAPRAGVVRRAVSTPMHTAPAVAAASTIALSRFPKGPTTSLHAFFTASVHIHLVSQADGAVANRFSAC